MIRIIVIGLLFMFVTLPNELTAQYNKEGYKFEKRIKPPRVRRPVAHEMMLDPMERFLIVSYSTDPTVVILYTIPTWEIRATYTIPGWFDLANSFMGPDGRFLYLDFARYSSQYRRVNVETNQIDTVECSETPKGCVPKEGGIQVKNLYTKDKRYYFTVNKKNKRDILIFQQDIK